MAPTPIVHSGSPNILGPLLQNERFGLAVLRSEPPGVHLDMTHVLRGHHPQDDDQPPEAGTYTRDEQERRSLRAWLCSPRTDEDERACGKGVQLHPVMLPFAEGVRGSPPTKPNPRRGGPTSARSKRNPIDHTLLRSTCISGVASIRSASHPARRGCTAPRPPGAVT